MKKLIGLILIIVLLIAGYFYYQSQTTCSPGEFDLVDTEWKLISLNGEEPKEYPHSSSLTLEFTASIIAGWGGCNGFTREYTLDGSDLESQDYFSFQYVGCGDVIMKQENKYLRNIKRAECVEVDGENLILKGLWTELIYEPRAINN